MKSLVEVFEEMTGKPFIFWIEAATLVSQKLEILAVLISKRISKKTATRRNRCGRSKSSRPCTLMILKLFLIEF